MAGKNDGAVIKLASSRDQFVSECRKGLINCARKKPESYVAVTISNGDIDVSWAAMSRARLIGALHMAIQSLTSDE